MPSKLTHRTYSPISIPGLSNKARDAVNEALDAMSTWRNETADASEKNGREVVDKMAAAAKALGWPDKWSRPLEYRCKASPRSKSKPWTK